jgi:hypothetical protein
MSTATAALDSGERFLFVVGCPRSGTTWVQRLLASHACVKTGQESDVFDLYVGPQLRAWRLEQREAQGGRGGVGLGAYFTQDQFLALLKDYSRQLMRPMTDALGPGEIFLEKTPSHVLFIDEILALYPRARFIHVLRDARDTVASLLGAAASWGADWAPRSARSAAGMWVNHVQAGLQASCALSPQQMLTVRYEDLHARGPAALQSMAHWLGLEWSDAELRRAWDANAPAAAKQGGGTPIPLGGAYGARSGPVVKEPAGFVRKAEVGSWRTDLSFRDRLQVWRIARGTMAEAGYAWRLPL